jgi:hypothetical protein
MTMPLSEGCTCVTDDRHYRWDVQCPMHDDTATDEDDDTDDSNGC